MNLREDSWNVDGVTRALLRQVSSLGFVVSLHRIPPSLLGRSGFVEMHAVDPNAEPPFVHLARVSTDEEGDIEVSLRSVAG